MNEPFYYVRRAGYGDCAVLTIRKSDHPERIIFGWHSDNADEYLYNLTELQGELKVLGLQWIEIIGALFSAVDYSEDGDHIWSSERSTRTLKCYKSICEPRVAEV